MTRCHLSGTRTRRVPQGPSCVPAPPLLSRESFLRWGRAVSADISSGRFAFTFTGQRVSAAHTQMLSLATLYYVLEVIWNVIRLPSKAEFREFWQFYQGRSHDNWHLPHASFVSLTLRSALYVLTQLNPVAFLWKKNYPHLHVGAEAPKHRHDLGSQTRPTSGARTGTQHSSPEPALWLVHRAPCLVLGTQTQDGLCGDGSDLILSMLAEGLGGITVFSQLKTFKMLPK